MTVGAVRPFPRLVTQYASPYAVIEAYVDRRVSADELVEILAAWDYAPLPDRHDPAGVSSEIPEYVPGSAEEIVAAATRGLIDGALYKRIYESIRARQGN
jgi:hypothetical protein